MDYDEKVEVYGDMIRRIEAKKRGKVRDYHGEQKKALDMAIKALNVIKELDVKLASTVANEYLQKIEGILK